MSDVSELIEEPWLTANAAVEESGVGSQSGGTQTTTCGDSSLHSDGDFELHGFPTMASYWTEDNALELGIYYELNSWQGIFTKCERAWKNFKPIINESRKRLCHLFPMLMDAIPLELHPSDTSKLAELLTHDNPLDANEKAQMQMCERRIECACSRLRSRDLALQTAISTGINVNIIRHALFGRVEEYLDSFRKMILKRLYRGGRIYEAGFSHLFELFSRIFMINLSRGGEEAAREMKIFGKKVLGEPDLRHELSLIGHDRITKTVVIVSVAEVKKSISKKKDKTNLMDTRTRVVASSGATTSMSSPPPKKRKLEDAENEFSDHTVRGRHVAELLVEKQYSIFEGKTHGHQTFVLGFIVNATKVRLTCLDIADGNFDRLTKPKYKALGHTRSDCAKLYYTKTYDMLAKEDWEDLSQLMITLGSFGDEFSMPLNALMCYLQPST